MRAVFDTNVVISGLPSGTGTCGRLLDLVLESVGVLCLAARILEEYREVARRPELEVAVTDADRVLDFLESNGQVTVALPLRVTLPDADDLPWLEVAASAGVPLVTGNTRHYPARSRSGVEVLSPRQFLDRLGGGPAASSPSAL